MRDACVKSLFPRIFFIQADETRFFSSALLRREGGALGLGDQMGGFHRGKLRFFMFSHVLRIPSSCVRCDSMFKKAFITTWWCGSQTYRNPVSMNS